MPAIIDKIADALHLGKHPKDDSAAQSTSTPKPVFDHNKVTVIFVLGGPGAGEHLSHIVSQTSITRCLPDVKAKALSARTSSRTLTSATSPVGDHPPSTWSTPSSQTPLSLFVLHLRAFIRSPSLTLNMFSW